MARTDGPTVVCVINLKGGVGKSTISALLARHAFSAKKMNVLAIDLDPQANLSQALMQRAYTNFISNKEQSIVEIFNGYRPPNKIKPNSGSLVPADVVQTIFETEDRSLELIPSRFDFSDNLINAAKPDPRSLARFLSEYFTEKDFIIIDCAPTESIFTRAAYHCSRHVLVPVKPEYFATIGFPLLDDSINDFRHHNRSHKIDVCGVVINNAFYDGGNDGGPEKADSMRDIETETHKKGWRIYRNQLPHSRGFPKLMRGNNSQVGNATEFYKFANEFFESISL